MKQGQPRRKLGKQPRRVSEKTKEKIIQAALTLFANEGFSNAKLRDIAALAGTTHNLIRHHFGSKEDLWKAVVDYGLQLNEARLKLIIDAQGTEYPVELFKTFIRSHIAFMVKHIDLSKILLHDNSKNSPHLDYIIEKQKGVLRIAEPIFNKVKACGYFKDFDHDSFSIYMRAITETPLATWDMTNKMLNDDIRSEQGIARHTERVINLLFHKDA